MVKLASCHQCNLLRSKAQVLSKTLFTCAALALSLRDCFAIIQQYFTKDAVANVGRDFFFTHQSQVSPSTYQLIFITALQQFSLPLGRFTPRSTVFRKAPGKSVAADQPWLKRQGLLICLGMELKDPIGWELFYGTGLLNSRGSKGQKMRSPQKIKGWLRQKSSLKRGYNILSPQKIGNVLLVFTLLS